MQITSKRYFNTTCHIVSFFPSELRLEPHNGIPDKRENIHYIWGNPMLDEVTALKATGSFFDGSNPKSEMLGAGRGDYFLNIAYDGERLYLEPDIPNGLKEISTSYALLRNGKESKDNEHFLTSILSSNPRMMMGQKASGEVVFIAADGRKLLQKGLTSAEQRKVCLSEGLHLAANNDGGGSVALIANDILLSKCYDGRALGYIWCGYRKWNKTELPVLKKGTKGMWVNLMQRYLTSWGIPTDADGSFGPATFESLKAFQKKAQITVDGSCGPQTWGELTKLQEPKKKLPTLIIDAGHGGNERGGVSGGYREKDLTLPIALRLQELLKDYSPALTRDKDIDLPIGGTREALVKNKYDYCLSIHLNINAGRRTECIHSIHSEKGKKLAEYICKELGKATGLQERVFSRENPNKPGSDYYAMHKNTGSTTCVIVELLPLDTCKDQLHIENLAQAVARGFRKFVENAS